MLFSVSVALSWDHRCAGCLCVCVCGWVLLMCEFVLLLCVLFLSILNCYAPRYFLFLPCCETLYVMGWMRGGNEVMAHACEDGTASTSTTSAGATASHPPHDIDMELQFFPLSLTIILITLSNQRCGCVCWVGLCVCMYKLMSVCAPVIRLSLYLLCLPLSLSPSLPWPLAP